MYHLLYLQKYVQDPLFINYASYFNTFLQSDIKILNIT